MKRASVLFALLSFLSLPLSAAKIPVTGRIVGPDGKPIPGARVSLTAWRSVVETGRAEIAGKIEPEPLLTATPDAEGGFRLEAPDAGMWRVRVEAPGFAPQVAALLPLVEEKDLPDAQLQPDAGLRVTVTDAQGKPAAGVRVKVEDSRRGGFLDAWRSPVRTAVTDATGTVSLPRGKDESLRVRAAGPGSLLAERENVREGTVSLRLAAGRERRIVVRDAAGKPVPGALVSLNRSNWPLGLTSEAGTLDLAAPPKDGVDLILAAADGRWMLFRLKPPSPGDEKKGPAAAVLPKATPATGRVVSAADGRPLAGALAWSGTNAGAFVRTGADGTFRLPSLSETDSQVSAAAAGFFEENAEVAGGRVPTFALQPRLAATGVVVDEAGRPVAGAALTASYLPNPGAMNRMAVFRSGGFVRSGANGRFRVSGLISGTAYSLKVTRAGFAPARLELPAREPDKPAADVRVVLRAGRAAFGAVVDGGRQPVAKARVSLRQAAPTDIGARIRANLNPETFEGDTDAAGRFEVRNIPPGTYDLTVRGTGFAPLTVPGLVLPEGSGRTDLGTVMLAPGASVRGMVTDPKGAPLAGVEIRAQAADRGAFRMFTVRDPGQSDAVTGADGVFVLADRSPGESLDLTASHPGFGSASAPGVAVPSETPVRLVLQPKVRVSGRTADPDGRPVAGASVFLSEREPPNSAGQVVVMMAPRFQQGVSDDEGGFAFEAVSPGPLELSAHAPRRQETTLEGLEAKTGQDLTGVLLVLAPAASVEGRVVSPDGAPVPGAEVSVAQRSSSGLGGGFSMLRATADGDGFYRIEGIPPGPQTLEARAEGYRRAARDVEAAGEVRGVDLTLERGLEVAGRVVDDAGQPIASAQITLMAGRNFFDAQRGLTGPDGTFRLGGVQDGTYRLSVRKDGYATDAEGETVTVAGAPVSGLEIRLSAGGAIVGRITGVEMSQLSRVRVWANSQLNTGRIDPEGNYRISNLPPGSWQVEASVPDTTLHASGQVTLEAGAAEARLDLQLGGGHELRGTVLRNGQPLAGATLALTPKDTFQEQNAASDHQGSFRFGGLQNGSYELLVTTPNGARHKEAVEISGDREIQVDLRTSALAGRVIDGADLSPVSGAAVTLLPADGERGFFFPDITTDGRGAFRVSEVGEGAWRLKAAREGYVTAERPVQIGPDGAPDDVEIRLEPTQGVTIEVLLAASGQSPDRIRVAVLGPDGRAVSTESYPTGENSRARASSVPPGSWQLLIESDQSAAVVINASVPGPAVRAVLPPACQIRVVVPALSGESTVAKVTFNGSSGPFRGIEFDGSVVSEWNLTGGRRLFTRLPAGTWQVQARTPDGRSWTGTANVAPGGVSEVTLQ